MGACIKDKIPDKYGCQCTFCVATPPFDHWHDETHPLSTSVAVIGGTIGIHLAVKYASIYLARQNAASDGSIKGNPACRLSVEQSLLVSSP